MAFIEQNCADERPENDPLFPRDILEAGRRHLETKKVEHDIHTYPEVPHGTDSPQRAEELQLTLLVGFAVVGEYPDRNIKKAQELAFAQMLAWLRKF